MENINQQTPKKRGRPRKVLHTEKQKKKIGRPRKYATDEERRAAKAKQTKESRQRKRDEQQKKQILKAYCPHLNAEDPILLKSIKETPEQFLEIFATQSYWFKPIKYRVVKCNMN